MMANIGSVLNTTLEDAGVKYKTFIDSLQSCLDVVNHNRQELAPQTAQLQHTALIMIMTERKMMMTIC